MSQPSKPMTFKEAVRKRPGMYIGEPDWRSGLRCIGMIANEMAAVIARPVEKEGATAKGLFSHHAFLDVVVQDRVFCVSINFDHDEPRHLEPQLARLVTGLEFAFSASRFDTLAALAALSDWFSLSLTEGGGNTRDLLQSGQVPPVDPAHPERAKSDWLTARFCLMEGLDLSDLDTAKLQGYILAVSDDWVGLVPSDIRCETA